MPVGDGIYRSNHGTYHPWYNKGEKLEKEKVAELKKKEKQECPTENKVEKKQEMRLKANNV